METGTETKVSELDQPRVYNFDELFSEIKPAILDEYFTSSYPQHPRFVQAISRDNIKESSQRLERFNFKDRQLELFPVANPFKRLICWMKKQHLHDKKAAARIRQLARENQGKNVEVKAVVEEFRSPYGYDPNDSLVFMYFYNGEITLKATGGKTITSSERKCWQRHRSIYQHPLFYAGERFRHTACY